MGCVKDEQQQQQQQLTERQQQVQLQLDHLSCLYMDLPVMCIKLWSSGIALQILQYSPIKGAVVGINSWSWHLKQFSRRRLAYAEGAVHANENPLPVQALLKRAVTIGAHFHPKPLHVRHHHMPCMPGSLVLTSSVLQCIKAARQNQCCSGWPSYALCIQVLHHTTSLCAQRLLQTMRLALQAHLQGFSQQPQISRRKLEQTWKLSWRTPCMPAAP